jgi:energy-coupling factor transporter ATP-binding protein EcfA2
MSQSLTLPDELFNKLAHGAAQRGLTIEALLAFVSDLVVLPDRPTAQDRQRQRRIERLLAKYQAGSLTALDRAELDRLIDADYQEANARADRLIAAKESQPDGSRRASAPHVRSSGRSAKQSQK